MHIYTYTCRIHIDAMKKTSKDFFKKIYLSLHLKGSKGLLKVLLWEGVGDRIELQHIGPSLMAIRSCVFLVLQGYSTGGLGVQFVWDIISFQHLLTNWSGLQTKSGVQTAPSAGWWLSLPRLVSDLSDFQLTDFLSSPSYIIIQSPTQSLEWHVWSSSSGNNCHAVHRSLSSGTSVYECNQRILPCPILSAKPAYAISSHNCHRNVSLPSGASLWNGMFGLVEGQYTTFAILQINNRWCPSEVVTNVLDRDTVIREFNLQQCNYVRIRSSSLEKKSESYLSQPAMDWVALRLFLYEHFFSQVLLINRSSSSS